MTARKRRPLYAIATLFFITILSNCTESFIIEEFESPDNVLVIEATITNENKFQEIYISKAFKLTEKEAVPETNATVLIKDENGLVYTFNETTSGKYVSSSKFSAQTGINYNLFITTSSGEMYESNSEKTTANSQIEDITVQLNTSLDGNNEFRFYVNSNDPTGKSKYYRYTYEETYKIIAPLWTSREAVLINGRVEIQQKADLNTRICYKTNTSNTIIQTKTTNLSEDRVQFLVRRIPVDDFAISHRYSLLVKQHVQSFEAYTYYSILNKFSNASDLLSQNQPGFFSSNIYSVSNNNEKVLGFFEVTSVSEKRVFFNYRDFFDLGRPPYAESCYQVAPEDLIELTIYIENGTWLYFQDNLSPNEAYPGPYFFVSEGCGDCTVYGSNIKPSFWVD